MMKTTPQPSPPSHGGRHGDQLGWLLHGDGIEAPGSTASHDRRSAA